MRSLRGGVRLGDIDAATVVIVEPSPAGHRFLFVRLLAEAALARGRRALLVTECAALTTPESARHLDPVPALERIGCPSGAFSPAPLTALLTRLRRRGALVVVPRADRRLPAALISRLLTPAIPGRRGNRGVVRCLVMRPDLPPENRRSSSALKAAVGRTLRALGETPLLLDDVVPGGRTSRTVPGEWVADPVPPLTHPSSRAAARRRFGVPASATVLGLVGILDARKNIGMVLEARAALGEDVVLLLVGRADEPTRRLLDSPAVRPDVQAGRIVVVDDYVPDAELHAAVAAADLLLLPYGNLGSSGILGLAIALGTPVVAAGNPRITATVRRHDIGVCGELSACGLADAIRTALAQDRTDALTRTRELLTSGRAFAERVLGEQSTGAR